VRLSFPTADVAAVASSPITLTASAAAASGCSPGGGKTRLASGDHRDQAPPRDEKTQNIARHRHLLVLFV